MKRSMQVTAMAAFFGCFAILAITAGGEKAQQQEKCGEKGYYQKKYPGSSVDEKAEYQTEKEVAVHWEDHLEELFFPAQFFHRII